MFPTSQPSSSSALSSLPSEWVSDLTPDELSRIVTPASITSPTSMITNKTPTLLASPLEKKLWEKCIQLYQQQEKYKEQLAKRHKMIEAVLAQSISVRDALVKQDARHKELEMASERRVKDQENQRRELEVLKRSHENMRGVIRQVSEYFQCPICTQVALLPKVLGPCGHIACQDCLKQMDDVAFSGTNTAGASARQQLLARRCPLCRVEIVGQAFPVMPMKNAVSILVQTGYVEVSTDYATNVALQKHIDAKAITYDKESAESKHIAALQLGCYAQSQLAQHSVNGVLSKVTPEQWVSGVYVLFEAAVSRVFYETFATTLHGKAGGLNVLVNASQRMLAVQLIDKTRARDEKRDDSKKGHVLIKVGTDGRFAITTTPVSPLPSETPATPATPATSASLTTVATPATPTTTAATPATPTTTVATTPPTPPTSVPAASAPAATNTHP